MEPSSTRRKSPCLGTFFILDTLRRFYKNWVNSKKKAFSKYRDRIAKTPKKLETQLNRMKKYCSIVRVIAHTQLKHLKNIRPKKNHVFEIQVNGGKDIAEKVNYGYGLFEKEVRVDQVFAQNENVDFISVTKGYTAELPWLKLEK